MKHTLIVLWSFAVFTLASCDNPQPAQPTAAPAPGAQSTPLQNTGATLTASPNPVTTSGTAGKTTITWNAGNHPEAAVYVTSEDAGESLFASGSQGSSEAPWIQPGKRYEFRLYSKGDKAQLLQQLTVTAGQP